MKKFFTLCICSMLCIALFAEGRDSIRIYINPGHGGYGSDDRNIVVSPFTSGDTLGFWESWSNLDKGLMLKQMLDDAGFTTAISRVQNREADDLALSQIVRMNNEFGSTFFLSIHSNAGGTANYVLELYAGKTPGDTYNYPTATPCSEEGRLISTEIAKNLVSNQITCWGNSNYSVVGDKTFARTAMGWSDGYGVLRGLTTPGVISEGCMHDYQPETYRLLNHDYRWMEAWHFYKTFMNYLAKDSIPTGNIAGSVRDNDRPAELPSYNYIKNSRDSYLPINGAKVSLIQNTDTLEQYTTDNLNNGFFLFKNLQPGNYDVQIDKEDYYTRKFSVAVQANEMSYLNSTIKMQRKTPPTIVSFSPENNPTDSISCASIIEFVFNWDMDTAATRNAFSIVPAVNGKIEFTNNNSHMVFTPNDPFTGATLYTVTLDTTACHPDTSFVNHLQQNYVSQFLTKAHDILSLISSNPSSQDNVLYIRPSFFMLFDAPLVSASVLDGIYVIDADGNVIDKNLRSAKVNKVSAPYGSYYFDIITDLEPGKTYSLVIDATVTDTEGLNTRVQKVLPFTVQDIPARSLATIFDPTVVSFAYDATTNEGVKTATVKKTTSVYMNKKACNDLNYTFSGDAGSTVRYNLRKPAKVDKNIKYYLSIKGDASGNTLSLLLKNADLSDSILVDVTTLNKVNWDEYEVDFADYISAGEEWTVAAVVITRSDKITSLTGDVYIECVYADVNTTTDVEQILSDNYKVWQNAENVYLQCPQSAVVNIYTIDGKMLLTVPAVADSADVEMRTINISALPTGSYIMNVVTESGTESVKIIK
ncbi:MAG: Ig-like domain-containing protein [Bacteroidales bacterium]|nr:Ig-like domain-containing protein [Bacteroidales bacterium]